MTSRNRDYLDLTAHQRPMVGDTKLSGLSIDHLGWLVCDGRLLNISEYQFLYNVIGYSFGSNGSGTQFKLPNPAGRVPGFVGSGAGLTTRVMGATVGEETHTLNINEMPSHKHGSNDVTGNTNGNGNTSNAATGVTVNSNATGITVNSNATGITTQPHTHTYLGVQSQAAASGGDNVGENDPRPTETTSATTVVINDPQHTHAITDPQHNHSITDPTHFHAIGSTGGSNAHNNMQPTLFIGNLFMYGGKYRQGSFPFTTGTNII